MLNSSLELIGKTPLVRLSGYEKKYNLRAALYAKLEWFSLTGSVKDRIAFSMITAWEKSGDINNDTVIIEPTSGNTGIGLAAIGSLKGYKVILVMPSSMSVERRKMISAYGAEIVLTSAEDGMNGAIKKAEELRSSTPNSIIAGQFSNINNPAAHFLTTAPEIWTDLGGKVDFFVAGAGTGGTRTGAGRYLKAQNPAVKIIAAEPRESSVISGGKPSPHGIQGIGAGFIPENLKVELLDEVICVSTAEAVSFAKRLASSDGLLVGISSGAAMFAAAEVASRKENAGKNIVVLFPDSGSKYMSTALYEE